MEEITLSEAIRKASRLERTVEKAKIRREEAIAKVTETHNERVTTAEHELAAFRAECRDLFREQ